MEQRVHDVIVELRYGTTIPQHGTQVWNRGVHTVKERAAMQVSRAKQHDHKEHTNRICHGVSYHELSRNYTSEKIADA